MASGLSMNQLVREYWEKEPCGTGQNVVADLPERSREWFDRVEDHRYTVEPFIHSIAQFTRHHGKRILEIGVGAGTDHLQWARAGARCFGVDLTAAAIETTSAHLAAYGFQSDLRQADAERLPFSDNFFDLVYSWGVIHHSERPQAIVDEVHRVLRPGGNFIGMMYGRKSLKVLKHWVYYALLRGKPWLTFRDVVANHVESFGTKAYTVSELRNLFAGFETFSAHPLLTSYDLKMVPGAIARLCPPGWGWFIAIRASK